MNAITNADKILFRCSSLSYIMTESRSKSEVLGETCKKHLVDKFVSEKYGRETDIHNKYITKGLQVEEDAITLYSRVHKSFFKKNEFRIENDFICGTPDLFTGEKISEAETIIDVKSSWDIFTFFRATGLPDTLNKNYYWQLQGYMALTGAQSAKLAYCLVDTPGPLLMQEMNNLRFKMGVQNPDTDDVFQEACLEIEKLGKYEDIPLAEKVREIEVPRNDEDINRLSERVKVCRAWMNENLFQLTESIA